ncbi:DNA-binding protein [Psychrobacter glacincola]|uniref:DNA-binding protein n=1 Tax=Psychrobacter glacincola TaxID=56810 RepID=UPI0039B0482E
MNKNDSTEQDTHDQLINLVTTLRPVIKALRELIKQADDAVATRLERSLGRIDGTVNEVTAAIKALGGSASTTSKALNQYQTLVLEQLQAAVVLFTENEMPSRYDDKIKQLIDDIKQQIDTALETVVTTKSDSLEAQVSAMQVVADKLDDSAASLALFTSQYHAGHEQIITDIETFETSTKERIGKVKEDADKDLDKIYKSIESMSIKRIAAAAAAATAAMVISLVALVFWYVPSLANINDLREQQAALQQGIDELETGWKQAFNNARSQQLILACDVNEEQPDVISWCVRADSKSVLRDEKGFVYYKIAELTRAKPTE